MYRHVEQKRSKEIYFSSDELSLIIIRKSIGYLRLANWWTFRLHLFIIRQSLLNELFNKIAHRDQRVQNFRHLYALKVSFVKPNIPARAPRILTRTTRQHLNPFSRCCRVLFVFLRLLYCDYSISYFYLFFKGVYIIFWKNMKQIKYSVK